MTYEQYQAYETSVAQFIADENIHALSTGCVDRESDEQPMRDWDGEPWFSWRPCECCGTQLGGNREYLYALTKDDNTFLQYTICEDCVYYINYGQLDDMTMMDIRREAESR